MMVLVSLQFFNPLFRKFDGSYWRLIPSQNVPQMQVPAWSDAKGRKVRNKRWIFYSKMMDFLLTTMDFLLKNDGFSTHNVVFY